MLKHNFNYCRPRTAAEALTHLKTDNSKIVAGGTDLIPLMKKNLLAPGLLVSLNKIKPFKKIAADGDRLFIGSMVTLSDIVKSNLIAERVPSLIEAAERAASPQIRNRGTIGGNLLQERRCLYYNKSETWRRGLKPCYKLGGDTCYQLPNAGECHAIYYSDIAPVLTAREAEVKLYRSGSETPEVIPVKNFIDDRQQFNGCLLAGFNIPCSDHRNREKFFKRGVRGAVDFAVINIAANYIPGESLRIVAGAVSSRPVELTGTAQKILNDYPDTAGKKVIIEQAVRELTARSKLIREAGISVKARKKSLHLIAGALEEVVFNPRR